MLLKLFFQNFWNQNNMREESSGNRACIIADVTSQKKNQKKPDKTFFALIIFMIFMLYVLLTVPLYYIF